MRATRSLVFDGTNEYGTLRKSSSLSFERTDAFSIGIWFKTSSSNYQVLIGKVGNSGDNFPGYELTMYTSGELRFDLISVGPTTNLIRVETVSTGWNDGKWHFLLCTYDGTSSAAGCAIYVDGVLETDTDVYDTLTTSIITSNRLQFGARETSGDTRPFTGSLSHASAWASELTAAEVWEAYNLGNPRDLLEHSANPNLVGWWPLGELGAWPYVLDRSGNRNSIQLVNMETGDVSSDVPVGQSRVSSKSLVFGGTDEYVTMGNVLSFDNTDPFSISFWFKTTADGQYIVSKMDNAANLRGYGVSITTTTGRVGFYRINSTVGPNYAGIYTNTAFNDGVWHHVVVTTDGAGASGMKIYVDGSAQATSVQSDTLAATIVTAASLNISGITDGANNLFVGSVDEVKIYDAELTASEVSELYGEGWPLLATELSTFQSLVGYWRCGDYDASPTITDLSAASGNDGTMTNMEAVDIQGDTPGVPPDNTVSFDGSTSLVSMGNVLSFDRLDTFSLSFWIKTTDTSGFVIGKNDGASPYSGYGVAIVSSQINVELINTTSGNWIQVRTIGTVATGDWKHVLVTYDGSSNASGVTVYIDGVEATTTTLQNSLSASITNAKEFRIGSRDAGWYTAGNIAHAAAWNIELSSAQALDVFNNGLPPNLLELSSASGLQGWWMLGAGDTDATMRDSSLGGLHGTPTGIDTSQFSQDYPVPSGDGGENADALYVTETSVSGDGLLLELGGDDFPAASKMYFRMRGWNTSLLEWETWSSEDEPDLTPPTGPCTNIQIEVVWD